MTERIERPADALKVGWRTDPGGEDITDPGAAKRADGYAFEDEVPHDELNWQDKLWGDLFLWLYGFVPREWTTLKSAIDAHAPPERFVINRAAAANEWRGKTLMNEPTASTFAPILVVTDGRRIYYINGDAAVEGTDLVGMDPEDGTQDWIKATSYTQFTGLASDGIRLYTMEEGENGVDVRTPSTGVVSIHGGTNGGFRFLATNGTYLIAADISAIHFYNDLDSTPVETGNTTINALDSIVATAIDIKQAYLTGSIGLTRGLFKAFNLGTRALAWEVDPLTTSQPNGHAVVCDGDVVFFGTDHVALTAGGDANLFAYDRIHGQPLGAWEVGVNSDNVVRLTVDDRYLYVTTENASGGLHREIHVLDRRSSPLPVSKWGVEFGTFGDVEGWAVDGVGLVVGWHNAPSADEEIRRDLWHVRAREFQRALGTDPGRAPFYNAATPLW